MSMVTADITLCNNFQLSVSENYKEKLMGAELTQSITRRSDKLDINIEDKQSIKLPRCFES